ncbi:hypothetical protein BDN71DRAFT_1514855 [Pleurotus eryngii]|uniref:Uncharacterized protein n=1 Tax=Pleurotus eryngii TaxID=5323 RepID=A0A9P5ZFQ5_PLEER|nr:hypothetical protein BDN71DRAFT_1514855 [Pleurotus eryngii]
MPFNIILANSLLKPWSTRSATAAAKAQQETNEEQPVEPVKNPCASAVKKIKKDKRCVLSAYLLVSAAHLGCLQNLRST